MKIGWSTDFLLVKGDRPAQGEVPQVDATDAAWIVVVRRDGRRYVLRRDEFIERLRRSTVSSREDPWTQTLADLLHLHDRQASTSVSDSSQLAPPDLSWRADETAPSARRYVEVDELGLVLAVGGADVVRSGRTRRVPTRIELPPESAHPAGAPLGFGSRAEGERGEAAGARGAPQPWAPLPEQAASADEPAAPDPDPWDLFGPPFAAASAPSALEAPEAPRQDEGTAPIRHPSIESDSAPVPGARVSLLIDLLREASASTAGAPLALGPQADDWQSIELGVTVVSAAIDFDPPGRGTITIRRNAASTAARLEGRVHAGIAPGTEIEVHAQFWNGARWCGSGVRALTVQAGADAASPPAALAIAASRTTGGALCVEPSAAAPDLTVFIALFDRGAPGRMHWRMQVGDMFDGLPPQLDEVIDLGTNPRAEAAAMFKQFATLERGQHRARIEGFGERLWDRAPAAFRAVYWALHDHHRRPLTIQFVSDDPHLPWELMRPFRDGETHPPLAVRHAVARWIARWHGYRRNGLSAGRLVTVAPKYRSASARLSLAEATAQALVAKLGARAVSGTVAGLRELLETPTDEPVALLYFTGHGVFDADSAAASAIKLEDGSLTVDEIARREVRLGERHGTLVFFNACEVGATAGVLGTVGGWADAVLSRRFRAFIAPLWAIDEEDAAQVTHELMAKIVTERMPIGAALRDLRAQHGDVSPTFFSYLLYGDVTARLDACPASAQPS